MTDNLVSIKSILSPELTLTGVPGSSKKRILEQISHLVSTHYPNLEEKDVFNNLLNRERLGSTGIGQGIAIPHCRLEESLQVIGALLTLEEKVPFDSIDNEPVDLLFVLLVPKEATSEHLDLLSQLAEKFNDAQLCKKLRACQDSNELYRTITEG